MSPADTVRVTIVVEVSSMFVANSPAEAEALLDAVMDAGLAIVCPDDLSRARTCSHCGGTKVNPAEETDTDQGRDLDDGLTSDDMVESETGARWLPGSPCGVCADTDHSGSEVPCVRDHTAWASMHTDGRWLDAGDRRVLQVVTRIAGLLDAGDVAGARRFAGEIVTDLADPEVRCDAPGDTRSL